jgi:hypothetical protein
VGFSSNLQSPSYCHLLGYDAHLASNLEASDFSISMFLRKASITMRHIPDGSILIKRVVAFQILRYLTVVDLIILAIVD